MLERDVQAELFRAYPEPKIHRGVIHGNQWYSEHKIREDSWWKPQFADAEVTLYAYYADVEMTDVWGNTRILSQCTLLNPTIRVPKFTSIRDILEWLSGSGDGNPLLNFLAGLFKTLINIFVPVFSQPTPVTDIVPAYEVGDDVLVLEHTDGTWIVISKVN